jgi:hypothetical protein
MVKPRARRRGAATRTRRFPGRLAGVVLEAPGQAINPRGSFTPANGSPDALSEITVSAPRGFWLETRRSNPFEVLVTQK